MATLVYGDRITRQAKLSIGCLAVIFDEARQSVLLTRRQDNGRWCLPGGHMEPGESVAEACAREIWEETGLQVQIVKCIGIYSDPNRVIQYADGAQYQIIGLCFEARPVSGTLILTDETTEIGYFTRDQMCELDVMEHHIERIDDAFAARDAAYIR